ncbi:MAG TPA: hypothetical protein VEK34_09680 [Methylocella sp.]|nr:hypothetical protein [Methylocella sp.]
MIPPQVWKSEICAGLGPTMVARTLGGRGLIERASDGFQQVQKICGTPKRVYVVTAKIFDGGSYAG